MVCEYEYDEDSRTMRINCLGCVYGCSIEDSKHCMSRTIDKLTELKIAPRIVMAGTRQYEYDREEAELLLEIGKALQQIINQRLLQLKNIIPADCEKCVPDRYKELRLIINELKFDPLDAYKRLKREIRHTRVKAKRSESKCMDCYEYYLNNTLLPMKKILDNCQLIKKANGQLADHKNRSLYRKFFHPTVRPNFMYTRFISIPERNSELVERYKVGSSTVEIYSVPGKTRKIYHLIPPEFELDEKEYQLLDKARQMLGRHEPQELELAEPTAIRENLYNIGMDMLRDLTKKPLSEKKTKELANILARYTAGLGILELLLKDKRVQDVFINSPVGRTPIYIVHSDYLGCETNIIPSVEDAESWATRFRLKSGRPLDEANPVLDTDLNVPGGRARVTAITRSLSPDGLGFAFRRHRDMPWTYPLFIKNKMLDSFSAGLLWFLIDGGRTLLIAGTRGSGKTSLLNATMLQIMPNLRIVTLEDTLELNVDFLRKLDYNVERLKSRSVITRVETEMPAEEALRSALRLGDSCLIMGEVRSKEALALYEAMRIGALANVVAGTIHGASAYGVFDRVVNDLGVPPTSFKATDIVLVCNTIKTPDGLSSYRRVTGITEVGKEWTKDPMDENGFTDLMQYSASEDKLKPTTTLLTGESQVLNSIAQNVKQWKGRWDDVWDNIKLRSKILQTLADYSKKNKKFAEAPIVAKSNRQFHLLGEDVRRETGNLDSEEIYQRWLDWLRSQR